MTNTNSCSAAALLYDVFIPPTACCRKAPSLDCTAVHLLLKSGTTCLGLVCLMCSCPGGCMAAAADCALLMVLDGLCCKPAAATAHLNLLL